jgi:hypothetical protein
MNEPPNNFVFQSLISGFRDELYELLGSSWCECVHQGFDQHRVERALLSSALIEKFDLAIESMGPEEYARFVCPVVNERLKSHQPIGKQLQREQTKRPPIGVDHA